MTFHQGGVDGGRGDQDDRRAVAGPVDFFISYTGADEPWAMWIAWQLEDAGHSTRLQAWDFASGSNFVWHIDESLRSCTRMVLVLSPDYLRSVWCRSEWQAALSTDPVGVTRKLLPVLVRPCTLDGLLRPIVYVSFLGCDVADGLTHLSEADCRRELLRGLRPAGIRPSSSPPFPGGAQHGRVVT